MTSQENELNRFGLMFITTEFIKNTTENIFLAKYIY